MPAPRVYVLYAAMLSRHVYPKSTRHGLLKKFYPFHCHKLVPPQQWQTYCRLRLEMRQPERAVGMHQTFLFRENKTKRRADLRVVYEHKMHVKACLDDKDMRLLCWANCLFCCGYPYQQV